MEKIDYQKTLNLPKTDFSMRAGLAIKEPQYLQQWEKDGLWDKIKAASKGRESFLLHDGPPYANGHIHIGHALNKILKDLIIKSKFMQGFDTYYVPGWDCHGLPIEHQLLKEQKKKKADVDCVAFRKDAHDYAMKFVDIQREEFKRLGVFAQWDNPYLTLDHNYEYWILKSLAKLNEKGYVYRGLKPVNWCYHCETALAEAEVEYEDHTSPSVYVRFKVKNAKELLDTDKSLSLLIWTTTPWTLLANVAVAVHENFNYSLVEVNDEVLIIESSLYKSILEKAGIEDVNVLKEVKGSELTSLVYDHPFSILEDCRVVTADYVTKEDGTGLVHTAPGHGQDDFQTGQKNKLEVLMPVNDKGVYTQDAKEYAGQFIFKANANIINDLTESGALLFSEDLSHSYPHCWRCKSPIIFRATHQWFMSIDHDGLRKKMIETVQSDVKWIPEAGEERISSMVATRPDWCLSRQRYWGVPIPALKSKSTGEHKLYSEVIESFAEIVKKEGTNAWFEKDVSEILPKGFKDPQTGEEDFEKTFDILDVWFDSGVSHQAVVKSTLQKELPIDMYLEGSDQHRGWFQSSLIPAVAMEDKAPYKQVLTHGFVVDGQGRKMSKSMGNVIAPQDIMKNSGADILRLWVASSSYNEDVRISKEILDRLVDAYRKIRNTFRYILGNLDGFNPDEDLVDYDEFLAIDQWTLSRLAQVTESVATDYNAYEFSRAFKNIYTFCNEDLSSFYLDILKDRLYTSASNSPERRAAQSVLYYICNYLVRILAPILMFTTEEIFRAMPKDEQTNKCDSVHLLQWLDIPDQWRNPAAEEQFSRLIELRPYVMKALEEKRREGDIGSSLEAKILFETTSPQDMAYLNQFADLSDMFVVSQAEVAKVESIAQPVGNEFPHLQIVINKADGKKCARSWKYSSDVGEDPDFPDLSLKSAQIVKEFLNGS